MPLQFRETTQADATDLATLLCGVFRLPPDATGFTLQDLYWKYWQPRGDVRDARSYVLTEGESIVAHCGLLPAELSSYGQQAESSSAHFIDWAAAPGTFTTGAKVLRKTAAKVSSLFAVGGSVDTRKMLPLLGFKGEAQMVFMARPLRPWRQMLTHQARNWKLPARFLRNAMWTWLQTPKVGRGWSYEDCSPDDVSESLWRPAENGRYVQRVRHPSAYIYFLQCPFARFRFLSLKKNGSAAGCVLLAEVNRQARIADLWLNVESPDHYLEAYSLATFAAQEITDAVEIVAGASTQDRLLALEASGYREYGQEQIMVLHAGSQQTGASDCQLIDNDGSFLTEHGRPYWT